MIFPCKAGLCHIFVRRDHFALVNVSVGYILLNLVLVQLFDVYSLSVRIILKSANPFMRCDLQRFELTLEVVSSVGNYDF